MTKRQLQRMLNSMLNSTLSPSNKRERAMFGVDSFSVSHESLVFTE